MSTVLERILESTREELERRKRELPLEELESGRLDQQPYPVGDLSRILKRESEEL
jgi:hypothetical protein